MTTASSKFSLVFRADCPAIWSSFLERFSATSGRICYYPSAGSDFRPLVYQQPRAMERLGFIDNTDLLPGLINENPLNPGPDYQPPDLWMFSDYCGVNAPPWIETGVLHCDAKVQIKVVEMTEIHPVAREMSFNLNVAYTTSLSPSSATGRIFYLRLTVDNAVTGSISVDAIYFCYENVNLIQQFILRHQVPISHLVWIRDGSGFGGGRLRHDFLLSLLPLLRTRWLFIQEPYFENILRENPRHIRKPRELRYYEQFQPEALPDLREIGRFTSGGDKVVLFEVMSAELEYIPEPWTGLKKSNFPTESSDPVYLWLCCEGWMKFGPFKWLRFDDQSQSILRSNGETVAAKLDGCWRVPGDRWRNWQFSDPTITTTREHPHPESRSPPPGG